MLRKMPPTSRATCAAIRTNGFACLTHRCCFILSRRRSKHRGTPISSCVSRCPKTVHVFSSKDWQKWILPQQSQRIDTNGANAKVECLHLPVWCNGNGADFVERKC